MAPIEPNQPQEAAERTARHLSVCAELADLAMLLARAAARTLADRAEPEAPPTAEPQSSQPAEPLADRESPLPALTAPPPGAPLPIQPAPPPSNQPTRPCSSPASPPSCAIA